MKHIKKFEDMKHLKYFENSESKDLIDQLDSDFVNNYFRETYDVDIQEISNYVDIWYCVDDDKFVEENHRNLLQAYIGQNKYKKALEHYYNIVDMYLNEFGDKPSEMITDIYETIAAKDDTYSNKDRIEFLSKINIFIGKTWSKTFASREVCKRYFRD